MVTTTTRLVTSPPVKPVHKIAWTEFQAKYLTREDRYNYEWVDGIVEKTPRAMDKSQLFIVDNLVEFLFKLKSTHPIDGNFMPESDAFFAGNHRRPDIAYYTKAQLKAARNQEEVFPYFVIEIISKNDQIERVAKKMKDYRKAGVKVIWHIFPNEQEIHVYQGKQMTVCNGEDLCSAASVIEGFVLPVKEVLK